MRTNTSKQTGTRHHGQPMGRRADHRCKSTTRGHRQVILSEWDMGNRLEHQGSKQTNKQTTMPSTRSEVLSSSTPSTVQTCDNSHPLKAISQLSTSAQVCPCVNASWKGTESRLGVTDTTPSETASIGTEARRSKEETGRPKPVTRLQHGCANSCQALTWINLAASIQELVQMLCYKSSNPCTLHRRSRSTSSSQTKP